MKRKSSEARTRKEPKQNYHNNADQHVQKPKNVCCDPKLLRLSFTSWLTLYTGQLNSVCLRQSTYIANFRFVLPFTLQRRLTNMLGISNACISAVHASARTQIVAAISHTTQHSRQRSRYQNLADHSCQVCRLSLHSVGLNRRILRICHSGDTLVFRHLSQQFRLQ